MFQNIFKGFYCHFKIYKKKIKNYKVRKIKNKKKDHLKMKRKKIVKIKLKKIKIKFKI
jgi:hypothetical protein